MWVPKGAALIKGRHLFEARPLLEEMRYLFVTGEKIALVLSLAELQM